jgi:hypothetical protein
MVKSKETKLKPGLMRAQNKQGRHGLGRANRLKSMTLGHIDPFLVRRKFAFVPGHWSEWPKASSKIQP